MINPSVMSKQKQRTHSSIQLNVICMSSNCMMSCRAGTDLEIGFPGHLALASCQAEVQQLAQPMHLPAVLAFASDVNDRTCKKLQLAEDLLNAHATVLFAV